MPARGDDHLRDQHQLDPKPRIHHAGSGFNHAAAPFDAIMVTCAPERVPQPLVEQLKDGGRIIIPVGPLWNQELVLLRKRGGKLEQHAVLPVRFVPMTGKAQGKPEARSVK